MPSEHGKGLGEKNWGFKMIIERILKTYINWEYINKLLDNAILVCEYLVLQNVFLTIERNYDFAYLIMIYIYLWYVAKLISREENHGLTTFLCDSQHEIFYCVSVIYCYYCLNLWKIILYIN